MGREKDLYKRVKVDTHGWTNRYDYGFDISVKEGRHRCRLKELWLPEIIQERFHHFLAFSSLHFAA